MLKHVSIPFPFGKYEQLKTQMQNNCRYGVNDMYSHRNTQFENQITTWHLALRRHLMRYGVNECGLRRNVSREVLASYPAR